MEKVVIHLKVYKGAKLSYNADGSVQNENHLHRGGRMGRV